MSLRCYFDGSEKHGRRLTLAAVAGDDAAWSDLETDWKAFLKKEQLPYTHMKEALPLKGVFKKKGWKRDKRDWFVNGLITFVHIHQNKHKGRLKAFTASVDLKAHAEFAPRIPGLPSPARMCVRGLVPHIFEWYQTFPDRFLDVIEFYFDRDEAFMQHIDADWKSADYRARFPIWGLIRTIEPVAMDVTPGIQVADLFAWSRTHVDRGRTTDRFWGPALMLCHPSNADHWIFDRAKIATYPPYAII